MQEAEVELKVEGMTCNNCASGISKSLRKAGFMDADANFIDGEVTFTLREGKSREEAIMRVEELGYTVSGSERSRRPGWSIAKKFTFCLLFTAPLFSHMFMPKSWLINDPLVQLALCAPVYAVGFWHFGRSAWGSLKAGMANMDVLIFIGSTAAFGYSIFGTIFFWQLPRMHDFMFFETAATIITLVLLGNLLEHRSVQQTSRNLGELDKMRSRVARIVLKVGQKEKIFETDPSNVKVGDQLQVNEGDSFPVDGTVTSGSGMASEASITGESAPVRKTPGSHVFSGTILKSGNLRFIAEQAAKDSTLQSIINLVKKARKDQPQIQVLGDKVSAIFVPVVLGIAALTFILAYWAFSISLTQSLMNAVAVLVISCPCAMGLATPTAVVAGVGRAAKNGILIKGGSTLERFAKADTIIFDKTGTLTTGDFAVHVEMNEIGDRAFEIIHRFEAHSSHPIARALLSYTQKFTPEVLSDIEELKGRGMKATGINGEVLFLGKSDGENAGDLHLKIDGETVAALTITDAILPGAKAMVSTFKEAGFKTVLLSGDRKEKVMAVAQELEIDEAYFEISPQGKLDFIEQASAKTKVVMVGDGINDGPALSRAQVGVSPGGASALAIDSARVVIMHSDEMQSLIASYQISRHTYLTIKQNLFWAFAYNIVAIPLAAFGFLNPMIAALAMAFSDVVVIGNSLRLKVKKID